MKNLWCRHCVLCLTVSQANTIHLRA